MISIRKLYPPKSCQPELLIDSRESRYPMFGCSPSLPPPPSAQFANEAAAVSEAGPSEAKANAEPAGAAAKRDAQTFKPTDGQRRGNGKAPEWRHVPARISALTPVLGHVSMLTALHLLPDALGGTGRIVTADRDEHVRISKWPEGWKVERFLLGQKRLIMPFRCPVPHG